ncbi:hypothetical protein BA190_26795 [Labrys sp. WJW]|uniref:hypothetical protein n=1 Tax=Labrys sp. WJW TaxID=1737983 RepID=UPI00083780DE|nr:hypothetical protein [Labrys sp. WJW]OCC01823.1 hypothetical protein BA190_26795 [Labrys sp. WJW]
MPDLFSQSPQVDAGMSPANASPVAVASSPTAAASLRPSQTTAGIEGPEILTEIGTEIEWRRRVYARRVEEGKMTQASADRKILIMELVLNRQSWIENHGEFLKACMRHKGTLQDCIDVIEGRGNFEKGP